MCSAPKGLGIVILAACLASCQDGKKEEVDWEIQSHYQRGSVAMGEGKLPLAEQELRKVLTLDDSHLAAMNKLARVLLERARRKDGNPTALRAEAIALLRKYLEREPTGKLALKEMARACREASDLPGAEQALERLIAIDASEYASWLALADVRGKKDGPDATESVMKRGLAAHPEAGPLLLAYGRFLLQHKREPEGRKRLEMIAANAPEYYEALDELGGLAAHQGRLADCRRIYEKLVAMNPDDYLAWELLAALDEREKDHKAAEEKYRRSLEIDRKHMSGWMGLGRALRMQEKKDEARYAFRRADGFLAHHPAQALELAEELAKLEEVAWALSVLKRARIATEDAKLLAAIEKKLKSLQPAPSEQEE